MADKILRADNVEIVDGGLLPILRLSAGGQAIEIVLTKDRMLRLAADTRAHATRLERVQANRRRGR